jgi:uncharacterized glyoxalase superfamily protein PhnB
MSGSTVIPCLRYRDARAAIAWLERVFGFQTRVLVPAEGDAVRHAQLVLGRGMLMVGTVRDADAPGLRAPDEVGGAETQTPYVVVADADAIYARAKAEGAEVLAEIVDAKPQGGRIFTCRDPQGHVWNVGSYDPWAPSSG